MPHPIFIVDDDPYWKDKLTDLFKGKEFNVTSFLDGKTFLEAVKNDVKDAYKIAIVDLILPNQNLQGLALRGELKKIKPYLPVFAITVSTDPQQIAEAMLKSGFDGFIAKANLDSNLDEYATYINSVIEENERYPEMSKLWNQITSLIGEKYKDTIIKGKFVKKLHSILKKSYFYLMLPGSMPLLPLVLTDVKGPYSESIIQSAIAIDVILTWEDKKWKKKIAEERQAPWIKSAHSPRDRKVRLAISKGFFPQSAEDEVSEKIFKLRDRCAHMYYEANKQQAIDLLKKTLELIEYYLKQKGETVSS